MENTKNNKNPKKIRFSRFPRISGIVGISGNFLPKNDMFRQKTDDMSKTIYLAPQKPKTERKNSI